MKHIGPALSFAAALLTRAASQRLTRTLPGHVDSFTYPPEPKYPADPPMDDDYVHDDLQPLDAFVWSTPAPALKNVPVVEGKKDLPLSLTCATGGQRKASWFSDTAPEGTPCVFGVDQRDEGGFCIHDDPAAHGPNGWCWTKEDRSEWGSCNDACPLTGQDKILLKSIQKTGASLKALMATLAKQLGNGAEPLPSIPTAPASLVGMPPPAAPVIPGVWPQANPAVPLAAVQAAPGMPVPVARGPITSALGSTNAAVPPPATVIAAAAGGVQVPPPAVGAAPVVQAPPPAFAQTPSSVGQAPERQAKSDLKSLLVDLVASQKA